MLSSTYYTDNRTDTILKMARQARTIRNASIPEEMVNKIVCLSKELPAYTFIIGTAGTLSRKLSFFKANQQEMIFFDRHGKVFNFSQKEYFDEIFMAINVDDILMEASVFFYDPFDGAYK